MRPIRRIVLHHSAGSELDTPAEVARYAVGRKVGITHDPYHYHVWRGPDQGIGTSSWRTDLGRDLDEIPASSHGENEGTIAVCVHGNYHAAPLPIWAQEELVKTVARLCRDHGLSAGDVFGHREMPGESTACPGYDPGEIRRALAGVLNV